MRILFITPYPPSRIRSRSYGFLKRIQQQHEVVILARASSQRERSEVETLRQQGYEVFAVEESKYGSALRTGRALVSQLPLQVAYAQSTRLAQEALRLCEQRAFDVVHVEHLRGICSVRQLAQSHPLVWDAVDCISSLYALAATSGPSLSTRLVARLDIQRTRAYEAGLVRELSHIAVTSSVERQALLDLARSQPGARAAEPAEVVVMSHGVDTKYFAPNGDARLVANVVFSGKMSYHANEAAALHLYKHIMPLIWQRRPEVTFTIVGSDPPRSIQRLASDPRVEVTGYVDDLRVYVRRATVMLCPMVYSVGLQNKVLESMALGTPVVASSRPAAALGVVAGRELLTADTPQEFADAALHLMDDKELQATLSKHGRAFVVQHHDWDLLADTLVEVYREAIATFERTRGRAPDALTSGTRS